MSSKIRNLEENSHKCACQFLLFSFLAIPAIAIPQVFQDQHTLITHTKEWHAEARQKIKNAIARLSISKDSYWVTIYQACKPNLDIVYD